MQGVCCWGSVMSRDIVCICLFDCRLAVLGEGNVVDFVVVLRPR